MSLEHKNNYLKDIQSKVSKITWNYRFTDLANSLTQVMIVLS